LCFQEIFVRAGMRVMAGGASTVHHTCVPFHGVHFFLIVAFEANLPWILDEEAFVRRLVGIMAGSALAIGSGVVLELRFCNGLLQVLVTVGAELAAGFHQKFLELGLVRIMAGGAVAILDRLMFDLSFRQFFRNVLMAFGAEFPIRFG